MLDPFTMIILRLKTILRSIMNDIRENLERLLYLFSFFLVKPIR